MLRQLSRCIDLGVGSTTYNKPVEYFQCIYIKILSSMTMLLGIATRFRCVNEDQTFGFGVDKAVPYFGV